MLKSANAQVRVQEIREAYLEEPAAGPRQVGLQEGGHSRVQGNPHIYFYFFLLLFILDNSSV